jgi:hypothetical protein
MPTASAIFKTKSCGHCRVAPSVFCSGTSFRLYARVFGRNISQFGYRVNNDIPEIETVFLVTFYDGSRTSGLFNSMASSLRKYVESAVLNTNVEIDNG